MDFNFLKCPSCGADIEFKEDSKSCECEYCGRKMTTASLLNNTANGLSDSSFAKKVKSSVDKSMRKGIVLFFNTLFVMSLFFAGILIIIAISDSNITMIFSASFCLIYGVMFKILAFTPKGSKYILGRQKGIRPVYFVLVCILLSFVIITFSPKTDTSTDTPESDNITATESNSDTE